MPSPPKQIEVVETYKNDTEWYRVYSDGWIEQGGLASAGRTPNIVFLKPFLDTTFSVSAIKVIQNTPQSYPIVLYAISNSTITFGTGGDLAPIKWRACGYGKASQAKITILCQILILDVISDSERIRADSACAYTRIIQRR